jgi:hypothetical protein
MNHHPIYVHVGEFIGNVDLNPVKTGIATTLVQFLLLPMTKHHVPVQTTEHVRLNGLSEPIFKTLVYMSSGPFLCQDYGVMDI